MNKLQTRIQELSGASPKEIATLWELANLANWPSGSILLKPGEGCQHYYFIKSGTIRIYHKKEEKDLTLWFAEEGEIFTNWDSFNN